MAKFQRDNIKQSLAEFFLPVWLAFKMIPARYRITLVYLFIPSIYLINVTAIHYSLGPFYMNHVDPEYFYMYNGVVLGAGNLSIQYFAHPGTPLHYMVMLSARITDLFQPGDYMKSFVDDPEKYVHAANLFINSIIALVLFFAGISVKRYSGSVLTGLTIQMVPFSSMELISLSGRVFPEAILIIPLLLTAVLVLRYIYRDDQEEKDINYEVFFGLIIGFGIAIKLTFIPVMLIPLVLLKRKARQKVFLLLYTLLFFMIFAYPVVFNIQEFWKWTSGIFSHSGKYGSGAKEIINFADVPGNFILLFKQNKTLFLTALGALILALFYLPVISRKRQEAKKAGKAIFAVFISFVVSVVFILKHFSDYYFTPFNCYILLLILLAMTLIIHSANINQNKLFKNLVVIAVFVSVILLISFQVVKIRSNLKVTYRKTARMEQENERIAAMVDPKKPIIISGAYFGAPFIETAHFNGFIMSARLKGFYKSYLKEKYPNSYFFVTWLDQFNYWSDKAGFDEILKKTSSSFYIYVGKSRGDDMKIIRERLWKSLDQNDITEKVLFQDPDSGEQLVEVFIEKND